jgi:hypothetical protein
MNELSPLPPASIARLSELATRAQSGDTSVLPELGQLLDRCPDLYRHVGDLGERATEVFLQQLKADPFVVECVRRNLKAMEADLAPQTPVERLLVERVVLTYLQAYGADLLAARPAPGGNAGDEQRRKRQDSANRRYLQSLAYLAKVRSLLDRAGARPAVPRVETYS